MSPKKNKNILKTKKNTHERNYEYVARMVNTYDEPLTMDMLMARNNLRNWKPTRQQMQSALHLANLKGLIAKGRDPHYKRMTWFKLSQDEEFFSEEKLEEILYKPTDFKKEKAAELEQMIHDAGYPEVKLHGRKITQYRFTARQFLDQLHEANRRLYEQALDAVEGSIDASDFDNDGWFTNVDGDMCIEVIE